MCIRKIYSSKWFFLVLSWFIITLFYMHQYALRVSTSAFANSLSIYLNMSATDISAISAAFFLGYIAIKIPAGLLIDRYGARLVLPIASVLCGIGSVIFAFSINIYVLMFSRFLTGVGATFALMGAISYARHYFNEKHFNTLNALTFMFGTVGAISGTNAFSTLAETYSINTLMITSAVISFLLGLFIFLILKNRDIQSTQTNHSLKNNILTLFQHEPIWFGALTIGLMYTPVVCYFSFWLMPHIHSLYNQKIAYDFIGVDSGFLGLLLGNPLFAWISNKTNHILRVMQAGIFISFLLLLAIVYVKIIHVQFEFLLDFLLGLSLGASTLIFTYVLLRLPKNVAGTASSFLNLFQIALGALFLPEIAFFLAKHHAKIHHHIATILKFHPSDYHYALSVLPITALLSFIMSFFL